uniref:C-type lectin domain-containing protein n=1 Tax=Callorhinchus milii TaxID=7868 RepID=A0A4W3HUD9_CALMI
CHSIHHFLKDTSMNKLVDREYYPINQLKNWSEARDYCRSHYTDLVSIRSPEEAKRTSQMIVSDRILWIGLFSKKGSTAEWMWTNGEEVNYTHWKFMQPNDYLNSDICVAVISGLWFDDYCNKTYQFMCYKGKSRKWDVQLYWHFSSKSHVDLQDRRRPKFDNIVPLWIGLYNKKGSKANWMWATGEQLNYAHWKFMEPNGYLSSPVCVAVSNGLWFDDFCNQTYQFMCQKGKIWKIALWAEARSYCTTYYTDIVSIRSTEENMYVTQLFSKDTPLWLGLYNNNRTTTMWEWINGDDFIYTHWKNKEPNAPLGSVIYGVLERTWVQFPAGRNIGQVFLTPHASAYPTVSRNQVVS